MSFIFGGNTGLTYDQLQARRRVADEMLSANTRTPRNIGEGLHAVGRALAARGINRRAAEREDELRGEFNQQFDGLFGGTSPSPSVSAPTGDMAGRIRSGLIERGLPEHVADGFVLNMQDESGLNPGINEISPVVPGSRGGFGLYQLTGPRRVAYEQFAAQRGVDPADVDAQLDFLVHELQGPESAAARSIFAAQDTPTAAAAILNDFLRPAEEHRASRERRYLGGAQPSTDMRRIAELVAVGGNPMANPAQQAVIQAMIQQEMSRGQPMSPMEQVQLQLAQAELAQMQNPQPERTPRILNYEYALGEGMTPEQAQEFAGGGGQTINIGPQGQEFAQPVTPAQEAVDEAFAESYVEWTQGGGADYLSQIARIEQTADQLEAIASGQSVANLTGPGIGSVPDTIGAIANPEAIDARERVEEVVQRNLRLVLGAQFTEREGERLIARAYNPRLPEAQNAARLRRLASTMRAAAESRQEQIDYYQQHGTLTGWAGRAYTMDDFYAAVDEPEQEALDIPAAPEGLGYTPERWREVWESMPEEDRALFR